MPEAVRVGIRVRPLNARELDGGSGSTWAVEDNSITQCTPTGKPMPTASFSFDKVFHTGSKTADVYNEIAAGIVRSTVQGFNGTIFAYGQTSSGKTHTMMGTSGEPGIIPSAIEDVFSMIDAADDTEFLLRVSCMEIYNETITDLFDTSKTNLKIKENYDGDVYVGDLTDIPVGSPEEVMELLDRGLTARQVASTKMNDTSSRSHTVFRVTIESRKVPLPTEEGEEGGDEAEEGAILVAHLNLVDLAGSERVANTGAEGDRLKEAGNINKSLLTLGSVIGRLADGAGAGHVPYRDSKLTRILQNSLGGNAKTAVICAVTPATQHAEETLSTLKFAARAAAIVNTAVVNEVLTEAAQLKRMKRTVAELERRLELALSGEGLEALRLEKEQLANQVSTRERTIQEQRAEVAELRAQLAPATPARTGRASSRRETWCPGATSRRGRTSLAPGGSERKKASSRRSLAPGPRRVSFLPGDEPRAAAAPTAAGSITARVPRGRKSMLMPPAFDTLTASSDTAQLEQQLADSRAEVAELTRQLAESNVNFEKLLARPDPTADALARAEAEHAENAEFLNAELESMRDALAEAESGAAAVAEIDARRLSAIDRADTTASKVAEQAELIAFLEETVLKLQNKGGLAAEQPAMDQPAKQQTAAVAAAVTAAEEQHVIDLAAERQQAEQRLEAAAAEHATAVAAMEAQRDAAEARLAASAAQEHTAVAAHKAEVAALVESHKAEMAATIESLKAKTPPMAEAKPECAVPVAPSALVALATLQHELAEAREAMNMVGEAVAGQEEAVTVATPSKRGIKQLLKSPFVRRSAKKSRKLFKKGELSADPSSPSVALIRPAGGGAKVETLITPAKKRPADPSPGTPLVPPGANMGTAVARAAAALDRGIAVGETLRAELESAATVPAAPTTPQAASSRVRPRSEMSPSGETPGRAQKPALGVSPCRFTPDVVDAADISLRAPSPEATVAELTAKVEQLEDQLVEEFETIEGLRGQLKAAQDERFAQLEVASGHEIALEAAQTAEAAAKAELERVRSAAAETEVALRTELSEAAQVELQKLQGEAAAATAELERVRAAAAEAEAALRVELEQIAANEVAQLDAMAEGDALNAALREQLAQSAASVEALQSQLSAATVALEVAERVATEREGALQAEKERHAAELEAKIAAATAAEAELTQAQAELEVARGETTSLAADVAAAKAQLLDGAALESGLVAAQKAAAEALERALAAEEVQRTVQAELDRAVAEARAQQDELEATRVALRTQEDAMLEAQQRTTIDLEHARAALALAEQELSTAQAELKLVAGAAASEAAFEAESARLTGELAAAQEAVADYEAQLGAAQAKVETLRTTATQLEQEATAGREAEARVAALGSELAAAQDAAAALEGAAAQVATLEERCAQLTAANEQQLDALIQAESSKSALEQEKIDKGVVAAKAVFTAETARLREQMLNNDDLREAEKLELQRIIETQEEEIARLTDEAALAAEKFGAQLAATELEARERRSEMMVARDEEVKGRFRRAEVERGQIRRGRCGVAAEPEPSPAAAEPSPVTRPPADVTLASPVAQPSPVRRPALKPANREPGTAPAPAAKTTRVTFKLEAPETPSAKLGWDADLSLQAADLSLPTAPPSADGVVEEQPPDCATQ